MSSIKVPPLGESIVEATVSRWLKKEGDSVASGETVVELETDKVTVEVPAAKAGVLVRRLHKDGDLVKVDDVLAEVDESGAADRRQTADDRRQKVAEPREASRESRPTAESRATSSPPPVSQVSSPSVPDVSVRSSPAARRAAAESGVGVSAVAGTGRGGVVSKSDVIEYVGRRESAATSAPTPTATPAAKSSRPSATLSPDPSAPSTPQGAPEARPYPAPPGGSPEVAVVRPEPPRGESYLPAIRTPRATADEERRETREKMSTRRKRIAEHLLQAQHATAHLTTFNEIDMSAVESLRARIKERIEREYGVRLTFMPFFVRAACLALKQFPMVNATVDGDEIVHRHFVHMGIAVASDAGLVVPNVKDADSKRLIQIGREIAEVAKKARDGKLTMDDLSGGTFTITNGGVFGSLVSTPIINYPQVAILGLHKIQDRPVVIASAIEIRPMMYVALSYDHRIIDGQHAVLFLVRIKELMEDPALMVVD